MQPLRELAKSASPILTSEEIKQVFSEVEIIYHFNNTLYENLKAVCVYFLFFYFFFVFSFISD